MRITRAARSRPRPGRRRLARLIAAAGGLAGLAAAGLAPAVAAGLVPAPSALRVGSLTLHQCGRVQPVYCGRLAVPLDYSAARQSGHPRRVPLAACDGQRHGPGGGRC